MLTREEVCEQPTLGSSDDEALLELLEADPVVDYHLNLTPEKAYFFYIGEIKSYELSVFLAPCLEKVYGRPVECIAIVPDVLASYGIENYVVINQNAYRWKAEGTRVNVRLTGGQFAAQVSKSAAINKIMEWVLRHQELVYLYMYESRGELSLADGKRIKLLGPEPGLALKFNNKIFQYRMACELGLPVAEGVCCESLAETLAAAETYFKAGGQIFVTQAYSAAGMNSIFASCSRDIRERFQGDDQPYLITTRIKHQYDPTVLAVVANDTQVYVASVADQRMEENRFRGSTFPTVLDRETVHRLKEYTRTVGCYLGAAGYRGIFGCDYMVDDEQGIYFVEVNARKQGTTFESTLTILNLVPRSFSLPELEFHAVTESRFPPGLVEMDSCSSPLCWGTYNVKCDSDVKVTKSLEKKFSERELFQKAAETDDFEAEAVIEDHIGLDTRQLAGGFTARCIAVGRHLSLLPTCLNEKESEVRSTMVPWE